MISPASGPWRRCLRHTAHSSSHSDTARILRCGGVGSDAGELAPDVGRRLPEPGPVRRVVQPAARPGGMRQRDGDRIAYEIALPDAIAEPALAEQVADGEPADRDDEARREQAQLPVAPERTEPLLRRARRAVAARRGPPRVAARHRGAVEARVEGVLLELEPAPQ